MKTTIKITTIVLVAAALLSSCTGEPKRSSGGTEAVFAVAGMDRGTGADLIESRAAHNYSINDYFGLGAGYDNVTVYYAGRTYTYKYNPEKGLLSGVSDVDIVRFPQDGSPLTGLVMRWPADGMAAGEQTVRDQSRRADFISMDRLEATADNVMPTTVIAVTMRHSRSKITFASGGIHAGKRIESLEVGEFKAFCDPALGDAQLIYDQNGDAGSLPKYAQGKVKFEGVAETLRFLLSESPDDALNGKAGNYTITLLF